jgi:enamine deaminase RidA (YjgF/YER057c/UK114 family)
MPASAAAHLTPPRSPSKLEKDTIMTDIKRLQVGPRMSQAVIHGDTVYLAGQVAQNAPGKPVAEQTRDILASIDTLLAEAGTDKSKILSANIWLASMDSFAEMNEVWDGWVSQGNTPARATVEARLAAPQFTVEIAVIAAR